MKRKIIALSLALITAFSLAACQATPEQEFVAKKDTDRLIEQAAGDENGTSALASLGIPEGTYTHDFANSDNTLNVRINAEVAVPDADAMPIVKVTMDHFTQKSVTSVFNFFYPNEKPTYKMGQVETKEQISYSIIELQSRYSSGNYAGTKEEYEEELANLQKLYASAPDKDPEGTVSDGTLIQEGHNGSERRTLHVADNNTELYINTYLEGDKVEGGCNINYSRSDIQYAWNNIQPINGTAVPDEIKGNLNISYEEALAECNAFFEAAGYLSEQFAVKEAYIIDDTAADGIPGENFAYYFIFNRMIADLPIAKLAGSPTNNPTNQMDEFSIPWYYETLEIYVDNDGIAMVSWQDPIKELETIQANSALLAFSDVTDIFDQMMKTTYEPFLTELFEDNITLDIEVSEIELTMLRIREQGGSQTEGLVIPVWNFGGVIKGTDAEGTYRYLTGSTMSDFLDTSNQIIDPNIKQYTAMDKFYEWLDDEKTDTSTLLIVNAIDGSIIDLDKGY